MKMKTLFASLLLTLLLVSCSVNEESNNNQNDDLVNRTEYEYHGETFLYHNSNGELEQLGTGDVYSRYGVVYVHLYDKIYPVYKNDNGNGHPSYILFNGTTKIYTDI